MFPRTVQYLPPSLLVHSLSSRLAHPALTCPVVPSSPLPRAQCTLRPFATYLSLTLTVCHFLSCLPTNTVFSSCPLIAAPSRSMHAASLRHLPLPRAHRVPFPLTLTHQHRLLYIVIPTLPMASFSSLCHTHSCLQPRPPLSSVLLLFASTLLLSPECTLCPFAAYLSLVLTACRVFHRPLPVLTHTS